MSFETEGYTAGYLSPEQLKEQEKNGYCSPPRRENKDSWNRSATDDLVKTILGPLARTWKNKETGRIFVIVQKGDRRITLGSGENYRRAFEATFVDPAKAREQLDELDPDWRKYKFSETP